MRTVLFMCTATLSVVTAWLTFGILTSCRTPQPAEPDITIVFPGDARTPLIDAADACASACDNLASLGCSDGTDSACVATCRHVLASHLTPLDTGCLTSAHSKAAARQCGGVSCL